MTALLPSSDVAIKPPPVNDTAGIFLSSALASVQKGVQEYRDAKQFQTELSGYENFYRSKGLTDVADLIGLQKNSANPDIPGALNGVDTSKRRAQLLLGINALGERELSFKNQEKLQKASFDNQVTLHDRSADNAAEREDLRFGREKQMLGVKEDLSSIDNEVKTYDKQISEIALSTSLSDVEKRTALTNIQTAKDAAEKKRQDILTTLDQSPEAVRKVKSEGPEAIRASSGPDGADDLPDEVNTEPPSADLLPRQGSIPIDIQPTKAKASPEEGINPKSGLAAPSADTTNPLPASVEAQIKIGQGNKEALKKSVDSEVASIEANIRKNYTEGKVSKDEFYSLGEMAASARDSVNRGDVKGARHDVDELQQQARVYSGRTVSQDAKAVKEVEIPQIKPLPDGNKPFRFLIQGNKLFIQGASSNKSAEISIAEGEKVDLKTVAKNHLLKMLSDNEIIRDEKDKTPAVEYAESMVKGLPSLTLDELRGMVKGGKPAPTSAPGVGGLSESKRGILDGILKGK
jgi:hypothetical protein